MAGSGTPLPTSAPSVSAGRSLLAKSVRRVLRTARTELRLFVARPRRARSAPVLLGVVVVALLVALPPLLLLLRRAHRVDRDQGQSREDAHFTHDTRFVLPAQRDWERVRLRSCSWLYLEFGAKDGRHSDAFFTNGNGFLEEYLRATQSSMRGFCAAIFEPDPAMEALLMDVREVRGRKARSFNVFAGVVPSATNGTEDVQLRVRADAHDPSAAADTVTRESVRAVDLVNLVTRLTYPWSESALVDADGMTTARSNGNNGTVIVRFNTLDIREAYWHLDVLDSTGVLCDRIDRVIVNLEGMPLEEGNAAGDIPDRDVVRDWNALIGTPSAPRYSATNGLPGLVDIANELRARPTCRTTLHVIDTAGKMLAPKVMSERAIMYSILAGQPTFDERVSGQTESWMTAVPLDRVAIFTNVERNADELAAARGRTTIATQPHQPALEKQLPLMQSWSHLVRVRESWDRFMRDDPSIEWLALVDDDTFVFPGGMREYLSMFDPRTRVWGGSGEQARIDNGDSGEFATWLRNLSSSNGGKHCYLENEDVPASLRGAHMEYKRSEVLNNRRVAHKVSHMCGDMFCGKGCAAVPQGAAIVVSRALVEALRPHIEHCESATSSLCKNCGSQRLYMCVNKYAGAARTLLMRGICRSPWKMEHREKFPFAVTYHGFQRYHGQALSTDSLHGDMMQLWQLGKSIEESAKAGYRQSYLVPMQRVANLIGCHGQGTYINGTCVTSEGIKLDATDGAPGKQGDMPGHHPSERKGSA